MPRSATLDEKDVGTVHPDLSNGLTEQAAANFTEQIEAEEAKIEEIMTDAAKRCQPHKDEIKALKKAAAEQGFEKAAFSASLRRRKHLRKADTVKTSLNEEQQAKFEQIELLLEGVPL